MDGYKHYMRVDSNDIVIYGFSNAFEIPLDTDIYIDDDAQRHFQLQLINSDGKYIYKYVNSQMVERTAEELFDITKYKQDKINNLSIIANGELNTFQSSALGTPHTYLIGQDAKGRDYMTLFAGEFSYITSAYYDPAKPIIWYTVESGNIIHSKDQFAQVFLDARDHVGNVKYKLADLETQINDPSVTTQSQVDAFVW